MVLSFLERTHITLNQKSFKHVHDCSIMQAMCCTIVGLIVYLMDMHMHQIERWDIYTKLTQDHMMLVNL